jgi:hypothetical protein
MSSDVDTSHDNIPIPRPVVEALNALVRAVNDTGPRCVGIAAVVVFAETDDIVLATIDSGIRLVSGINPIYALMDQASRALAAKLEEIPREIEPERLQ